MSVEIRSPMVSCCTYSAKKKFLKKRAKFNVVIEGWMILVRCSRGHRSLRTSLRGSAHQSLIKSIGWQGSSACLIAEQPVERQVVIASFFFSFLFSRRWWLAKARRRTRALLMRLAKSGPRKADARSGREPEVGSMFSYRTKLQLGRRVGRVRRTLAVIERRSTYRQAAAKFCDELITKLMKRRRDARTSPR